MLGWTIDNVAMVISLTSVKLLQLSILLEAWPPARAVASEYELRSFMGKLLHVSEVVRPGKFGVGCIINQLGMFPVRPWDKRFGVADVGKERRKLRACVRLGPEFHAYISFWRMVVQRALGPEAQLLSLYLQPQVRTLWSDARGDAMGRYCLESGCWWPYDFDENLRARVRPKVFGRDDLSINLLELLATTVTAWAFTVQASTPPDYPGEKILGEARIGLITDVVASSTSADQLRSRLGERTSRVVDLGTSFAG